jgi:plasmid stabilization system protein ParE
MNLKILDQAEADLIEGFHFYETQQTGIGDYFLANLYVDIESLRLYGGIHLKPYKDYHRLLSKRFPFAVFYTVNDKTVFIHAVLDCRRDPAWLRKRLGGS